MKIKNILLISLFAIFLLLLITSATALISNEFGTGVQKGNYTVYKGNVTNIATLDNSFKEKNYTLQQFADFNLSNFDFNLQFTNEVIFDKEQEKIFYVYTAVTGRPLYTNGQLSGMQSKKYEIKQGLSYDRWLKCRSGEMPYITYNATGEYDETGAEIYIKIFHTDKTSCALKGKELTTINILHKLKKEKEELTKLQKIAQELVYGTTDEVYNDFMN